VRVIDDLTMAWRIGACAVFVLLLQCGALTRAWDGAEVRSHPATFLSGVAAGILVHETGHVAVAAAHGIGVGLHNLSIIYPGARMTDREHLRIASAGIQAQWLLSEALLRGYERQKEKEPSLGAFKTGLVVSHLATTAAYLTVLKDNAEGDLLGMSDASGLSTDQLAALVAIPAALDAWRLFGEDVPSWMPDVSLGFKGAAITVVWTF